MNDNYSGVKVHVWAKWDLLVTPAPPEDMFVGCRTRWVDGYKQTQGSDDWLTPQLHSSRILGFVPTLHFGVFCVLVFFLPVWVFFSRDPVSFGYPKTYFSHIITTETFYYTNKCVSHPYRQMCWRHKINKLQKDRNLATGFNVTLTLRHFRLTGGWAEHTDNGAKLTKHIMAQLAKYI